MREGDSEGDEGGGVRRCWAGGGGEGGEPSVGRVEGGVSVHLSEEPGSCTVWGPCNKLGPDYGGAGWLLQ